MSYSFLRTCVEMGRKVKALGKGRSPSNGNNENVEVRTEDAEHTSHITVQETESPAGPHGTASSSFGLVMRTYHCKQDSLCLQPPGGIFL